MAYPELKELTQAEQLFDAGNLDEALEILNDNHQFEGLDSQQISYFKFLKGLILWYQFKAEELIELGEQIFNEGQNLNDNLQSFDGLFFIILGLVSGKKVDKALENVKEA
ncbi:MAG: hypothetical protein ACFE9R_19305, partial [Candidatus Hermodarchaeota archaeon]